MLTSSLLVGCGLPGGMMGSMMADLKGVHAGINMHLRKKGEPELSVDDLLVRLFDEVAYVWPRLGYPPLAHAIQPVRQERRSDERLQPHHRQGSLGGYRQQHVGYDPREVLAVCQASSIRRSSTWRRKRASSSPPKILSSTTPMRWISSALR